MFSCFQEKQMAESPQVIMTVCVSVTRVRVRSWRFLPAFFWWAARSKKQARAAHGNLHAELRRDRRGAYWTVSVWADEKSMRQFMLSGVHRQVMPRALEWFEEAAVVHWSQDTPAVPTLQEAHGKLQQEGRATRVRYPSEAQRKFEIRAP
jgi:hypothetical protein